MQNGNTHHYLSEDTYKNTRLPTEQATSLIPNAYTEKEFFDLEQKQVFGRNWVCVGAASQVRDSGNIIVAEVGGQSLIITRDEDGELRAFYNVCRHRGTRLCEKDGKVNKHIVCPYHGWGYNLRGDCVGTPLFDKGENRRAIQMHDMSHLESFDKKDYGLFPVRVAQWGAMLFACLDDEAPPLSAIVGDLPERLANFHMEEWTVLNERTYDIRCNWKLLCENAIEYYHLPWVHPRLAKTSRIADHHRWQGSGMYSGICTSPVTTTDDSGWLAMKNLSSLNDEQQISGYFFSVFPNLIVFIMPSHAFVLKAHPITQDHTIEQTWLIAHPQCTAEADDKTLGEVMKFWDDVNCEDIDICQKVQQGLTAKPYPGGRFCYQFEEPVHRFQNMLIDSMVGRRHIPPGDDIHAA